MARRRKAKSDKPVGGGGARHPNSLANLRSAPPAPLGHTRSLIHGGRSELLLRDVDAEVRELMDALGEAAPVRDPDGNLPPADVIAVEVAARALKRYRHLAAWLDAHGRIKEKTGDVKAAAELELRAERQLTGALDRLAMHPMARSKLGLRWRGRIARSRTRSLTAGTRGSASRSMRRRSMTARPPDARS
jgi:hypothetical protein